MNKYKKICNWLKKKDEYIIIGFIVAIPFGLTTIFLLGYGTITGIVAGILFGMAYTTYTIIVGSNPLGMIINNKNSKTK